MHSSLEIMDEILRMFPDFQKKWEEYLQYWESSSPGLCLDLAEFAHWLEGRFNNFDIPLLQTLFQKIEFWVSKGTQDIQDAVATCFLESLQNAVDAKKIPGKALFKLLGPESIAYCRAWDKFNGCQTEGFWDEE